MSCSSGGCRGKCCAVFYYPASPEELRERWEKHEAKTDRAKRQKRDDLYIADMLVPLGIQEGLDRADQFDLLRPTEDWPGNMNIYTCKHWDEESRLCTAYEDRPDMCKDYPYERECDHGCGYESPPNIITKWLAIRVETASVQERRAENSNPSP